MSNPHDILDWILTDSIDRISQTIDMAFQANPESLKYNALLTKLPGRALDDRKEEDRQRSTN